MAHDQTLRRPSRRRSTQGRENGPCLRADRVSHDGDVRCIVRRDRHHLHRCSRRTDRLAHGRRLCPRIRQTRCHTCRAERAWRHQSRDRTRSGQGSVFAGRFDCRVPVIGACVPGCVSGSGSTVAVCTDYKKNPDGTEHGTGAGDGSGGISCCDGTTTRPGAAQPPA